MGVCKFNTNPLTRSTQNQLLREGKPRGGIIGEVFECPAGGGVENIEKKFFCVLLFSANVIKRSTGVRKQKKTRGSDRSALHFGGSRCAIHGVWRKRCSPAPLPKGSDQGPGERVGRGVI